MWLTWVIIIVILAIIEFATINLTTIWFILSGIVALIMSFFTDNLYLEFSVFVILGIILFFTTRPLLVKWLKVTPSKTNLDRVIGMTGKVTKEIVPNEIGEVKVDGKTWSAISKETIKNGELVEIIKIDGVKLLVTKVGDKRGE